MFIIKQTCPFLYKGKSLQPEKKVYQSKHWICCWFYKWWNHGFAEPVWQVCNVWEIEEVCDEPASKSD